VQESSSDTRLEDERDCRVHGDGEDGHENDVFRIVERFRKETRGEDQEQRGKQAEPPVREAAAGHRVYGVHAAKCHQKGEQVAEQEDILLIVDPQHDFEGNSRQLKDDAVVSITILVERLHAPCRARQQRRREAFDNVLERHDTRVALRTFVERNPVILVNNQPDRQNNEKEGDLSSAFHSDVSLCLRRTRRMFFTSRSDSELAGPDLCRR